EDGERTGGLRGRVWTLDLVSGHSRNHPLTRRPQCADCGAGAGTREQQPLVLEPRPARFGADGGLRIEPPAATERRLARHVSPITGVVHDIVAVHTDAPISCFAATHQQGAAVDFDSLRRMNRWASAGKGVSPAQARASALCEALERYAGIFDGEEPRRRARLDALGHEAIGPDELLLFSARQYAARAEQPTRDPLKARWVPAPFDRQQPISWTRAWSLTDGAFRYLPTAFCYYGFHDDDLAPFCYADSNGNAAGNCVEEAILQGLFELVERDAVALWWYSRARRPALDLERFDEPSALALQRYYERRGGSMWVLDVTSDLGIAVFVAVARDAQGRFALGMGAHVNARLALTRAVSELGQVASAFEATRALPPELADDVFERWHDQLEPRSQPQLLPDASAPPRTRADVPSTPDYGDLREGVLDCVERLRARGLQMLVLELTRPDIDLAVVKVVVPGLRHMWPRLAAGRLYDVPVALGWIDEPLAEEALNPLPLII
ncbi:MAG: TOMM precursor leader peptide-binding protein, partial [Myxococcales bacterium]|nr:TOMM precursor leader peptide-binding protein [Myxococcales bacterium]